MWLEFGNRLLNVAHIEDIMLTVNENTDRGVLVVRIGGRDLTFPAGEAARAREMYNKIFDSIQNRPSAPIVKITD